MEDIVGFIWNGTVTHVPRARYFLYGITPGETLSKFKTIRDIPEYFVEAYIMGIVIVQVEELIATLSGRNRSRFHDRFVSYIIMSILMLTKVSIYGAAISSYMWIHENFRLVDLPSDSTWVWFACLFYVDFLYYWLHRARHEVNLLWADHSVHHSSQDYNFNTSFRVSPFEYIFLYLFLVLFCAPVIPPTIGFLHIQIFYIYQYSLHTELIPHLGPLEWVFNTPSAHRVHHGRTRDCIDKNYGATFIIWDRLFGTYESEKDVSTPVPYGLVHPIQSFNAWNVMTSHYQFLWRAFREAEGAERKFKTLFYGPGWVPGDSSRLGTVDDIPLQIDEVKEPKFDIEIPLWFTCYMRIASVIHTAVFYFTLISPDFNATLTSMAIGIALFDGYLYHLAINFQFWMPAISSLRCLMVISGYEFIRSASPWIQAFMTEYWFWGPIYRYISMFYLGMAAVFGAVGLLRLGLLARRWSKLEGSRWERTVRVFRSTYQKAIAKYD